MIRTVLRCLAGALLPAVFLGIGPIVGPSAAQPGPQILDPAFQLRSPADSPLQRAKVVYLTFDDGPHPVHTPQILEILASRGIRSTFFVVGRMVLNFPEEARQIVDAGHSIQLHSWRHDNLTHFNRYQFIRDTDRTQAVLAEVVGRRATCIRPPYGEVNTRLMEWAADLNLKMVLWDTTGADWLDFSSDQIAQRVVNSVQPGSVVLLHDGGGNRSRTVAALEAIVDDLTAAGYRFRPMCSSLPVTEPPRTCWGLQAWPEVRPCPLPDTEEET